MHSEPSASRPGISCAVPGRSNPMEPVEAPEPSALRKFFTAHWSRLVCRFREHDLTMLIRWSSDEICLHIHCQRCGRRVAHIDFPKEAPETKDTFH